MSQQVLYAKNNLPITPAPGKRGCKYYRLQLVVGAGRRNTKSSIFQFIPAYQYLSPVCTIRLIKYDWANVGTKALGGHLAHTP